jgi:hypothetical protein
VLPRSCLWPVNSELSAARSCSAARIRLCTRPTTHNTCVTAHLVDPTNLTITLPNLTATTRYRKGVTTHLELSKTNFLSIIANMTPFSDHNQSPRNMYQCQMAKQTMGFPLHSYAHRSDNKLYCLRTPQTPMVRPRAYDDYNFDECVAFMSLFTYTLLLRWLGWDLCARISSLVRCAPQRVTVVTAAHTLPLSISLVNNGRFYCLHDLLLSSIFFHLPITQSVSFLLLTLSLNHLSITCQSQVPPGDQRCRCRHLVHGVRHGRRHDPEQGIKGAWIRARTRGEHQACGS